MGKELDEVIAWFTAFLGVLVANGIEVITVRKVTA